VDDTDSYSELCRFVDVVANRGGVRHFVVHARKALLDGLSPEDNRRIPALQYERVYALCRDFPELRFTLNGGLRSMAHVHAARAHARQTLGGDGSGLAGVMLGRAAWERPWEVLSDVDRAVYGATTNPAASRRAVIQEYCAYADAIRDAEADAHDGGGQGRVARFGRGHPRVRALVKPLLNLFTGVPRGKVWRAVLDDALLQHSRLSEEKQRAARVGDLIGASLRVLSPAALDEPPPATAPHGDADAMEVLAHGFGQAAMPCPRTAVAAV
jgi:tRNA-dihydrouridine synthase A